MEGVIEARNYTIIVEKGFSGPNFEDGDVVRVGFRLLELDVRMSVLGELVASLLLPPLSIRGSDEVKRLVDAYRARVVVEQAYDLKLKLGPLTSLVSVPVEYFPVSRMSLLKRVHSCKFSPLTGDTLEALRADYSRYASRIGEVRGKYVVIRGPALKYALESIISPFRSVSSIMVGRIVSPPPEWQACGDVEDRILVEPWSLIEAPEGAIILGCGSVREAAGRALGVEASEAKCKSPRVHSSSVICEASGKRVVVKEYVRMIVKWIASLPLSYTRYRYRLTPKARMTAEYKYFRELRGIVDTPNIHLVCGDHHKSLMVRSYLPGRPVIDSNDSGDWAKAGETLALIHKQGYSLGDPNPGNIIVGEDGRAKLIDAEQVRRYSSMGGAWDIAVFIVYSLFMGKDDSLVIEAVKAYKSSSPQYWKRHYQLLRKRAFWAPLSILPHLVLKANKLIKEVGE